MRRLITAMVVLAAVITWAAWPAAGAGLAEPVKLEDLAARCSKAYVFIGGGSGAIISPDGYVITNAHVAGGSHRWKIRTPDGTYYHAGVVGMSPGTDLCLLKIDQGADLPYLPLGDSDQLEMGDVVIAVGNPFALGNIDGKPTVTLGVVSALHVDRPHAYDAIQTDTPINPGNSGGPLINLKGELVGVNAQIQTRFGLRQNTGVGYAISSNQVARFLPALKEADGKAISTGRIPGITLDSEEADKPPVVKEVDADSDLAKAGLKAGDAICAVGKAPVETVADFRDMLARYPVGAETTLRVKRKEPAGEEEFKVQIVRPGRAYLGIKFDIKSATSMAIEAVEANSPAERAKIQKGDVLIGIGPVRVTSRRVYYALMYRLSPGLTIPVTVRRGTANVTVQLVVGEQG